jgi:fatty-acid desaturase
MRTFNFPLTPMSLWSMQLVAHAATVYWLIQSPSLSDWTAVFFVYFLTGCLGMSVCYHRLLTHRSFYTPLWVEQLFTVFATLGLTGSSLSWTAAHRQHHAKADKDGDPHSPQVLGYWRAQWASMFSPIDVSRSPVLRSKFHVWMHRHYLNVNLLYGAILYIIGDINAVLTWWLVPACLLWNAGSLINTVCHTRWMGYKCDSNRADVDRSVNNPVLGLLMWGEGWHNNHHVYQRDPSIGKRWFEIDIGYWVICLIRKQQWNTSASPLTSADARTATVHPLKRTTTSVQSSQASTKSD